MAWWVEVGIGSSSMQPSVNSIRRRVRSVSQRYSSSLQQPWRGSVSLRMASSASCDVMTVSGSAMMRRVYPAAGAAPGPAHDGRPVSRPGAGRSRWLGPGTLLHFDLCRAIRRVLAGNRLGVEISRRARSRLDEIRRSFPWVDAGSTAVVRDPAGASRWWTFAGIRANAMLGELIGTLRSPTARHANLSIRLRDGVAFEELKRRLDDAPADVTKCTFPVTDDAVNALKFSACLPRRLAVRTLQERGADRDAVRACLGEPLRQVTLA